MLLTKTKQLLQAESKKNTWEKFIIILLLFTVFHEIQYDFHNSNLNRVFVFVVGIVIDIIVVFVLLRRVLPEK